MALSTYRRPLPLKEAAHVLGITLDEALKLTEARAPASPQGGPPRLGGTTGPVLDRERHPTRLVLTTLRGTPRRTRADRLARDPRVTQASVHRERNRLALMARDGAHPSTSIPRAAFQLGRAASPEAVDSFRSMFYPSAGAFGETRLRRAWRPAPPGTDPDDTEDGDLFDAPGVDIESLRWVWEAKRRCRFEWEAREPQPKGRPPTRPPVWPRRERGFRVWHQDPIHPDDLPLRL
jgi:hypothetical protein